MRMFKIVIDHSCTLYQSMHISMNPIYNNLFDIKPSDLSNLTSQNKKVCCTFVTLLLNQTQYPYNQENDNK